MIDRIYVEMALELSAVVALVVGVVVFLLCKAAALLTAIFAREGGLDPLLRNAFIISAVLLTLDLALLGVLFYSSLPHEPRPLFAEEPGTSPLLELVPLLVPLAGNVMGLSVTTAVARESPGSMKKYLALLAVASLVLLTLQDVYDRLVKAFEQHNAGSSPYALENIKFFVAILAHYAAVAHVPLHAVVNYDGQLTGQHGVHSRFESELFSRYARELRVDPPQLEPVSQPLEHVFDTLLESYQRVAPLLEADRQAIGDGTEYDDAYFARFYAAMRPTLEERLSKSAASAAALVAGAWNKAGRPSLPLSSRGRSGNAARRDLELAGRMRVFLIPTGAERYEPYCEVDGSGLTTTPRPVVASAHWPTSYGPWWPQSNATSARGPMPARAATGREAGRAGSSRA